MDLNEIPEEEATVSFAMMQQTEGELSDDELEVVAGGKTKRYDGHERRVKSYLSPCTDQERFWTCDSCGKDVNHCHCSTSGLCCGCKYLEWHSGLQLCMHPDN